jgi:hypothetical protein
VAFTPLASREAHDSYSEGDYWWPSPKDTAGPHICHDGRTKPDNFVAHPDAMRRLGQFVPALVSAKEIRLDTRLAAGMANRAGHDGLARIIGFCTRR